MLTQRHLSLRLSCIKRQEEWTSKTEGWDFIFPTRGHGKYVLGPVAHPFGAGSVLVVNTGDRGKVCPENGEEMAFSSFSICIEHLFPLFAPREICLLEKMQSRLQSPLIYSAPSRIASQCHRLLMEAPSEFNLDHRGVLLRVATTVLSAELSSVREGQGTWGFTRVDEHINEVLESLSTEEMLDLPMAELARRFSCSHRHLNRLFNQFFGYSVMGLRMEMRLLRSISLLRDPNMKIIHVAAECGFSHLGLFNTCFKRRFGLSPGKWRKNAYWRDTPNTLNDQDQDQDQRCRVPLGRLCPLCAQPETEITQGIAQSQSNKALSELSSIARSKRYLCKGLS